MKWFWLFLFFVSCSSENPSFEPVKYQQTATDVWVCHNPSSSEHGKLCTEDCLEPGNNYKFCWLLQRQDCLADFGLDWQLKNCMYFSN